MMVGIILGILVITYFLMSMFFKGCFAECDKQEEDLDQMEWLREYNRRKDIAW